MTLDAVIGNLSVKQSLKDLGHRPDPVDSRAVVLLSLCLLSDEHGRPLDDSLTDLHCR